MLAYLLEINVPPMIAYFFLSSFLPSEKELRTGTRGNAEAEDSSSECWNIYKNMSVTLVLTLCVCWKCVCVCVGEVVEDGRRIERKLD